MNLNASDSEILRQINERSSRMEARLFGATENDEGFVQVTTSKLVDYGKRIGSLELWRSLLIGGGAVLTYLVAQHLLSIPALPVK